MCGAYYLLKSPKLRQRLGIESLDELKDLLANNSLSQPDPFLPLLNQQPLHLFRPTDKVPFFFFENNQIQWHLAEHWWLVLESQAIGRSENIGETKAFQPATKWASFNSRIDKFFAPKSQQTMHRIKPYSFRVVIPADGFIEWQPADQSKNQTKRPLSIRPNTISSSNPELPLPFFLGGVAKAYPYTTLEGQQSFVYSCSIVTLGGHTKLQHIHEKSIPLILNEKTLPLWLDPARPWDDFKSLVSPRIENTLIIDDIDVPNGQLTSQSEIITTD